LLEPAAGKPSAGISYSDFQDQQIAGLMEV